MVSLDEMGSDGEVVSLDDEFASVGVDAADDVGSMTPLDVVVMLDGTDDDEPSDDVPLDGALDEVEAPTTAAAVTATGAPGSTGGNAGGVLGRPCRGNAVGSTGTLMPTPLA